MAMVYCRACAKELHETALNCPQCGAVQQAFVPQTQAETPWLAIVSLIFGIICGLTLFDDSEWDSETILGVGGLQHRRSRLRHYLHQPKTLRKKPRDRRHCFVRPYCVRFALSID